MLQQTGVFIHSANMMPKKVNQSGETLWQNGWGLKQIRVEARSGSKRILNTNTFIKLKKMIVSVKVC